MGMDGEGQRVERLRPAAVTADAEAVAEAAQGFHRAFPRYSAKRTLHVTQILTLAALGYGVFVALKADASLTLRIGYVIALTVFAASIVWRLIAAAQLTPLMSRLAQPKTWPTYTVLCPLYREANVTPDLIAALERLDYPGFLEHSHQSTD